MKRQGNGPFLQDWDLDFRPVNDLEEVDWDSYPDHSGEEAARVFHKRHSLTAHYARDVGAAWDDDKRFLR